MTLRALEFNIDTGATISRDLTAEEVAEREALAGLAAQEDAERAAAWAERTAAGTDLRDAVQVAMARLTAIVNTGSTFTAAQVREAMIDLARVQRRVLRRLAAEG